MRYIVYKITNNSNGKVYAHVNKTNGKVYIGQTTENLEKDGKDIVVIS